MIRIPIIKKSILFMIVAIIFLAVGYLLFIYIYYDSLEIENENIVKVEVCGIMEDEYNYSKFYIINKNAIVKITNKCNDIRVKKRNKYMPRGSKSPTHHIKFNFFDGSELLYCLYGGEAIECVSTGE